MRAERIIFSPGAARRGIAAMDETDIWRSAHLLIQRHANMAELIAAMRMDKMIERGDPAGEAAWRRILNAIKELRRTARSATEKLQ